MRISVRKYTYYAWSVLELLAGLHDVPLVIRLFVSRAAPRAMIIRLRGSGVRFKVRGRMDVWSVKETFLDRFYERHGTAIGAGWAIIDIGAGIGDFTIRAALADPRNRVYAFEPFPESFALLRENLLLNGVQNAWPFVQAIGSETGEVVLDPSSGDPLQVRSCERAAGAGVVGGFVVPSFSLAEVFEYLGLEHCQLLKLDCEGAEYPILFHTSGDTLHRIDRIVMEYHDGSRYTHRDLTAFLERQGYRVRTAVNAVHAHTGFLHAWREDR